MSWTDRSGPPPDLAPRPVCPRCRRPTAACICDLLPRVDNQTPVYVLQHLRERQHPFNTVALLRRALGRVAVTPWGKRMPDAAAVAEAFRARLPAGTALLYPGPETPLLSPSAPPAALLLIDGTWAQAKTLLRDLPWLRALPRFRVPNPTPDRYRIRAEPNAEAASTLEAAVRALELLEPDTAGLAALLSAFDAMIDRQLAFVAPRRPRRQRPRRRPSRAVPASIRAADPRTVLAIGETVPTPTGRALVYWTALRPRDGACFAAAIAAPDAPLDAEQLARFELPDALVRGALSPAAFASAWRAFLGDDALLVLWSLHDRRRLPAAPAEVLALKSVYCNLRQTPAGHLEQLLAREDLAAGPPPCPGRAGRRLAQLLAVWRWLAGAGPPPARDPGCAGDEGCLLSG